MAYDVYTLSGFILDIKDSGEFDKRITFFSKEHGVISIKAISLAKSTSKLRGFIVRFCFVYVDIVHGRTGYRLVRARSSENGFLIHKKESYFVLARFSKLIELLLPEGANHIGAFNVFDKLINHLEKNVITNSMVNNVFYYHALVLLRELGYVDKGTNLDVMTVADLERQYNDILNENGITNMIYY